MEEPAEWCYNETAMKQNNTEKYSTPIQLKLPVDMERIIKISDPVYSFNEVMEHIDHHKPPCMTQRRLVVVCGVAVVWRMCSGDGLHISEKSRCHGNICRNL